MNDKFIYFLQIIQAGDTKVPSIKKFFPNPFLAFEYGVNHMEKYSSFAFFDLEENINILKIDKDKCPRYEEMFKECDVEQYKERIKKD
jgi:hypothetical protein